MYKQLNCSIKEFLPTKMDFEQITNMFLEHNFVHSGQNLFGEQYEAWVYEYLKAWALNCKEVSAYVLKNRVK